MRSTGPKGQGRRETARQSFTAASLVGLADRFVSEHRKNPAKELSIYGQEKERATTDLCRLNLAVHILNGSALLET